MYANSNSSSSKASNNIPEWKKKLIMRKRGGSSVNNDDHCPCNSSIQSESDSTNFSSKICRSTHSGLDFTELSSLKTVTIGNLNVELRSVKSDSPSDTGKFNCLSGFESENDEDLEYGPGIVDRLREKFLNMGVKKQHKQVRRYSSLENLPCSYVRPFKLNTRNIRQNGFKVGVGNHYASGNVKKAQSMETLIYSTHEPPIFSTSRCALKARILAQNLNPDEKEEPSDEAASQKNFIRAPSINEDELPKPDTVKHVKKLFEQCTSANNDIKRSESEERPLAKLCVKKSPILDSLSETETVLSDIATVEPSVPNGFEESNETEELHQEVASSQDTVRKDPWESTSVIFDFRGKDVKPNISLSPAPFGCRSAPKKRSGSPPRNEVDDDEEDWDEMDIGADLPAHSGIIFDGENVKVGRGAILETRNKKLSIQFDDQATSTFEYPSEYTSPSPDYEDISSTNSEFNSLLALGSLSNSRFAPSNIDFELGVSQPLHRLPTNAKPEEDEKLDEPLDAIVPAKPEDASGWSSTNTTDILF